MGIATLEYLPLVPRHCTLYELALDSLILESRGLPWEYRADLLSS
jgi:hypothetical protein